MFIARRWGLLIRVRLDGAQNTLVEYEQGIVEAWGLLKNQNEGMAL